MADQLTDDLLNAAGALVGWIEDRSPSEDVGLVRTAHVVRDVTERRQSQKKQCSLDHHDDAVWLAIVMRDLGRALASIAAESALPQSEKFVELSRTAAELGAESLEAHINAGEPL